MESKNGSFDFTIQARNQDFDIDTPVVNLVTFNCGLSKPKPKSIDAFLTIKISKKHGRSLDAECSSGEEGECDACAEFGWVQVYLKM